MKYIKMLLEHHVHHALQGGILFMTVFHDRIIKNSRVTSKHLSEI